MIPAAAVMDLQTVPLDLLVKVQPVFYSDPTDAVFKALGVSYIVAKREGIKSEG